MRNQTPFFPEFKHVFGGRRKTAQQRIKTEQDKLFDGKLFGIAHLFSPWISDDLLNREVSGKNSRERIYSVRNTFWAFLHQVMVPQTGCAGIVKRIQAETVKKGARSPSSDTGAYCKARQRLPLERLQQLFKASRDESYRRTVNPPAWKGRQVRVVDGTCLSMPDEPELQAEWPQSSEQKVGCGFPMLKMVGLFDLCSGLLIDWAEGNKHQHESTLFRKLWRILNPNEILVSDRGFNSFAATASLKELGVDTVMRNHIRRKIDFRQGKKLGPNDRLITWTRPANRTAGWTLEEWKKLPKELVIRAIRFKVEQKGFRTKEVTLVTTLTNEKEFSADDFAELYMMRWRVELFFRDIKISMGMDVLRCKSVSMVRKEICMHCIAHNLIRSLLVEVAILYDHAVDRLSFKHSIEQVRAWESLLRDNWAKPRKRKALMTEFYELLIESSVVERPDRAEPRVRKRRPKNYRHMNKPRKEMHIPGHRNRPDKKYAKLA